jgi:hypothetical protein
MSLVAGVPANVFDFGNLALVNVCIHTTRASEIEHTHTTAGSSALGYNNSSSIGGSSLPHAFEANIELTIIKINQIRYTTR